MYHGSGDLSAWGWLVMSLGMLVLVGVLIAGAVAFVHYLGYGPRRGAQAGTSASADPETILAARFARGEIEEAEYLDRLAALRAHARS